MPGLREVCKRKGLVRVRNSKDQEIVELKEGSDNFLNFLSLPKFVAVKFAEMAGYLELCAKNLGTWLDASSHGALDGARRTVS